ncbi:MAG: hypothetical protein KGQ52_13355 [Alphaproteobacteria bacterium]|nr:hypothetical protein [Alphaproteobacteria bacterium]
MATHTADETDLRQGVTAAQHAVLDELERRVPTWAMMQVPELERLTERALIDEATPNWPRIAALALHLAERTAKDARNGK